MTPEEFSTFPDDRKVNLLLTYGIELIDRIFIYYVIKLYEFNGIYVEIWYHQTSRKIDKVVVLSFEDVVHLYEKRINISNLFK